MGEAVKMNVNLTDWGRGGSQNECLEDFGKWQFIGVMDDKNTTIL